MTWNYRVMRTTDPDGTHVFAIHEVYYDAGGAIEGWTENAARPQGETFAELTGDCVAYQAALQQPVIAEIHGNLYEIGPMGNSAPKLAYRAAPRKATGQED